MGRLKGGLKPATITSNLRADCLVHIKITVFFFY